MSKRQWYTFSAKAETPEAAELLIYDEIGASFWNDDAVTAKAFLADLAALPEAVKTLKVRVNSPGGDPFDATAIANALRAQSTERGRVVEVSIEGIAASAATIVTCAGDAIRIADNALMMVHDPSGLVWGTAADMRSTADALDRIRDSIVATYGWVSSLGPDALRALMSAETWMDASEALKNGFATEIVTGVKATASFRPDAIKLATVPEAYRARVAALTTKPAPAAAPQPADPAAIIRACKAAGFPELAEDLLNQPLETVTAALEERKGAKASADARATEIRALCTTAKFPDLAEHYIAGGMAVDQVQAQLTTLTAKRDAGVIDNAPALTPTQPGPVIDVGAIYRERNQPRAVAKGA